jgi:hypothetical protein
MVSFTITPLTDHTAAEVVGLDFAQPVDADIRSALIAILSQPVAVASVVLIAGVNAAIWLLVFQRLGLPPALASLLLLPPLTLLVPLYVVLAAAVAAPQSARSCASVPASHGCPVGSRQPAILAAPAHRRDRVDLGWPRPRSPSGRQSHSDPATPSIH